MRLPTSVTESQLDCACSGRRAGHAVDLPNDRRIGLGQHFSVILVVPAIQPCKFHFAQMKRAKDAGQWAARFDRFSSQVLMRAALGGYVDIGAGITPDVPVEILTR